MNEIEKWIFFQLINGYLTKNSISSENLLKPFKNSRSSVPAKKQLQKAVHNLRNQLPELLEMDKTKKHELILTKRKTQFTNDTTYRFYIPELGIKGSVSDIISIKGLLSFIRQLLSYNNEIYLREIARACNKILELIKQEYQFYLPLVQELEQVLKSYDLMGLDPSGQIKVFAKLVQELEQRFITNDAPLLNEPVYKSAKVFLGYYYGYNYATNRDDKISQNIQKIYIDKNNNLKSKQISSAFKYMGNIKVEDSYLFIYADLIGENGFVHQVLTKPLVATSELKFLFGSFTAFSVDRSLCFGKRILVKIDSLIPLAECKVGYLGAEAKEKMDKYFAVCFEHVSEQITIVKLPAKLELEIRNWKVENGRSIDMDWLNDTNS